MSWTICLKIFVRVPFYISQIRGSVVSPEAAMSSILVHPAQRESSMTAHSVIESRDHSVLDIALAAPAWQTDPSHIGTRSGRRIPHLARAFGRGLSGEAS